MQKNQEVLGEGQMEFSMNPRFFSHPETKVRSGPIYPVFLPFSGCRTRCVFCAQPLQTGRPVADRDGRALRTALVETEAALLARRAKGQTPPELAFYGGTFTAQPEAALADCLASAFRWRDEGLIAGARCSTRPDAVDGRILDRLRKAGFSRVELGVQSFTGAALDCSRRGYGREDALAACALVQDAGLSLGVQLMPGMPGLGPDAALADAALAASLRPDFVRLYPCLVLDGTELALWWRQGRFMPWPLRETAEVLAEACLVFWREGVVVARIGLAEEPGLAGGVLAGPRHPALGSMVRSRALLRIVSAQIAALEQAGPYTLEVPRRHQGEFFGHGNELAASYAALGLARDNVRFTDADRFTLRTAGEAG